MAHQHAGGNGLVERPPARCAWCPVVTQRIRVVGGPWPERHGAEGIIAEPTAARARQYPFVGCPKWQVIVLLDDDPIPHNPDAPFGQSAQERAIWTCCRDRTDVEFLP